MNVSSPCNDTRNPLARLGMIAASTIALAIAVGAPAISTAAKSEGPAPSATKSGSQHPHTLDELLRKVKAGWRDQSVALEKRENEFVSARDDQQRMLEEAQARKERIEARCSDLEGQFERNERSIAELEETLRVRLGTMGELFGVIRQVAGDTRSNLETSIVSAQFPGRGELLAPLAQSKDLPTIEQLEQLWFSLQQEMVESGRVARFSSTVVAPNGSASQTDVVRVGTFNTVANGRYLQWLPEVGKLAELERQPPSRYLGTVGDLEASRRGLVRVAVDPSRGSVLSLLLQTPSAQERIDSGGPIGYLIIALGLAAFFVALWRIIHLLRVSARVRVQQKTTVARNDNPLGRVMQVYADAPQVAPQTLENKLDEAIVREQTRLAHFIWAIKVVSVVAPLMGLLGTVTGMIQTFQAITLFGTGDPKLMAGGISEALVTTMLGLMVAIPLTLMHSWLSSIARNLTDVLGEQAAGIIATVAERGSKRESIA